MKTKFSYIRDCEIKGLSETGTFNGYASVFDKVDLGGDVVKPGAFSRTVKQHAGSFPLLWQHNTDKPIGMVTVEEDSRGLKVTEGKLSLKVSTAQDAYALLLDGIVNSMSIGYQTVKEEWDKENNTRNLKEVKLYEVSLVTFPMNESAKIRQVKSLSSEIRELVDPIEDEEGNIDEENLIVAAKAAFLGFDNLSQEESEEVKSYLENCYRKVGRVAPWEPQPSMEEMKRHVEELESLDLLSNLFNSGSDPDDNHSELEEEDSKLSTEDILKCFDFINKK